MHGAVLLDSEDRVLRPAILWNDMRSDKECDELTDRASELHRIAGNLAMPGFTAPKLLWVKHNEPDIFRRTACVLLPKDYLRLHLTGTKVSDRSEEHTSELQSHLNLVCRLLLEKKKENDKN